MKKTFFLVGSSKRCVLPCKGVVVKNEYKMLPLSCLIQPNTDDIDLVEGNVSSELPSGKNIHPPIRQDSKFKSGTTVDEIDVYV